MDKVAHILNVYEQALEKVAVDYTSPTVGHDMTASMLSGIASKSSGYKDLAREAHIRRGYKMLNRAKTKGSATLRNYVPQKPSVVRGHVPPLRNPMVTTRGPTAKTTGGMLKYLKNPKVLAGAAVGGLTLGAAGYGVKKYLDTHKSEPKQQTAS